MKRLSEEELASKICKRGHKGQYYLISRGEPRCKGCEVIARIKYWAKKHPRQPFQPLEGEEWRPVIGCEGLYEVSNLGRVRSLDRTTKGGRGERPKLLRGILYKPIPTKKGYVAVRLVKGGKWGGKLIHRLVAEAFIDNPLNLPQVNHIDAN